MADASANPYTATAAVLQTALLGVENAYPLQPMETGDCCDNVDAKTGAALNLKRATMDLEADTILGDAVGRPLVDNHIAMKRHEAKKTRDLEGDRLRDFYIHYV